MNINDSGKFHNQYRIKSIRLPDYDYGQNGAYFVTICTEYRAHFFGEIDKEKMQYSNIGKITDDYWQQIPQQFSFATLGEWIIMPNHIHGILIFDRCNNYKNHIKSGGITKDNNPMLGQNLSTIIRWFKGKTTFTIRKINPKFSWQTRFYDHVIRSEKDYNVIAEYITVNPQNWENDASNRNTD